MNYPISSSRRRHTWRWWRWENNHGWRKALHSRPHIGRRRARRVLVNDVPCEVHGYERRSAAGRGLAFQKPPYFLHLETILAGPYTEDYAGYRAAWWWQRLIIRSRELRGLYRPPDLYHNLYRPHPLQGRKSAT